MHGAWCMERLVTCRQLAKVQNMAWKFWSLQQHSGACPGLEGNNSEPGANIMIFEAKFEGGD